MYKRSSGKEIISKELSEPEYIYELPQERLEPINAPLMKRASAFIIDFIAYMIIIYPLFIRTFQAVSGLTTELMTMDYLSLHPELFNAMFGILVSSTLIFCFYMSVCEHAFGETLGKHFMNIHVEGKTSLWSCIARNLLKTTFIMLLPLDLIGLMLYNQRLIDHALGIKVLYSRKIQLSEGFN